MNPSAHEVEHMRLAVANSDGVTAECPLATKIGEWVLACLTCKHMPGSRPYAQMVAVFDRTSHISGEGCPCYKERLT